MKQLYSIIRFLFASVLWLMLLFAFFAFFALNFGHILFSSILLSTSFLGLLWLFSTRFLKSIKARSEENLPLDFENEVTKGEVKIWHHVINILLVCLSLFLIFMGFFMLFSGNFEVSGVQPFLIACGCIGTLHGIFFIWRANVYGREHHIDDRPSLSE